MLCLGVQKKAVKKFPYPYRIMKRKNYPVKFEIQKRIVTEEMDKPMIKLNKH